MTSTMHVQQEEPSSENDLRESLMLCIRVLLQSLADHVNNPNDDENNDIGLIRIIVDEKGTIASQIQEQSTGASCGYFIMCVASIKEAYELELLLAQCAYNTELIFGLVKEVSPEYADPQWSEELTIACEEVAEVLIKASFILPKSPMDIFLRQATQASRC